MTCGFCSTGCGLTIHLRNGEAVGLTPDASYPVNSGMACPKGWEALTVLKSADRATTPLLKDGRVRRAYLGLVNTPIQLQPSAVVRTGHREGLLVVEVLPGSPAERSGLRAGDVLLKVGEKAVSNAESLQKLLFAEAIGVPLELAVLHDGTEIRVLTIPEEMTEK